MDATKLEFEDLYNFPGVLGVIDGTHVPIAGQPRYVHSSPHSMNIQIVCNAQMMISNINSTFPNLWRDSIVFEASAINTHLEDLYQKHPNTFNFLLGECNSEELRTFFSIVTNINFRKCSLSFIALAHEQNRREQFNGGSGTLQPQIIHCERNYKKMHWIIESPFQMHSWGKKIKIRSGKSRKNLLCLCNFT